MTKNEFLSELENALEGRLPGDEVSEIVADYNDIFESGILDGKSEEAASFEIGSPAKIARRILEDAVAYKEERRFTYSEDKKTVDIKSTAPLSRRFGAYVTDALIGAFLLIVVMALFLVPFLFTTHETVVGTEGDYRSEGKGRYTAKLYEDNNGIASAFEVMDLTGNTVFKGNKDDFVHFLDSNKIKYPEDFKSRTHVRTYKVNPYSKWALIVFIPYMIALMFLGAGNIFNAIFLWKLKGRTPGKMLFKVRVEKNDGTKLTFADALFRELVIKTIGNAVLGGLLNVGSFIWACITNDKKTVHDLGAKTRVVEVKGWNHGYPA